jgi:hypothetical protein
LNRLLTLVQTATFALLVTHTIFLCSFSPTLLTAATISGMVQQNDGTALTGETYMSVRVFLNNPCDWSAQTGYEYVATADGTYSITDLPAGTYYLQAIYTLPEWIMVTPSNYKYAGAFWGAEDSPRACDAADPIQLTTDATVTGIDIRLNRYATLSGSIFQEDGVTPFPITSGYALLKQTQCDISTGSSSKSTPAMDSTFTIPWPTPGTYYLLVSLDGNFTRQWWTSTGSTEQCATAEAITIDWNDALSGMDIRMTAGATISGTVYRRSGNIPLIGTTVKISAYRNTSCEDLVEVQYAFVNKSTGTYEMVGLPAGDYLLRARGIADPTLHEWWSATSSVDECGLSSPISLAHQQSLVGKNFQLTVRGDVNDDFRITVADPIAVLQIISGMVPTPVNLEADLDQDGTLGMAEVIYLLQDLAYRR